MSQRIYLMMRTLPEFFKYIQFDYSKAVRGFTVVKMTV